MNTRILPPFTVNMLAPGELFGGAERQLLTLARGLMQQDIVVTADLSFDRVLACELRRLGVPVNICGALLDAPQSTALRDSTPVIQHSHGPRGTFFAWLRRHGPLVRTEHGLDYADPRSSLKARIVREMEERILQRRHATAIFVTNELLEYRSKRMRRVTSRIIYNGADLPPRSNLPRPVDLPTDRFNLVFAGRLDTVKQPLLAISAALTLPSSSRVKLFVIGDGPLYSAAAQMIGGTSSTSRVQLCGFRRDALDYIAHADAVVMPSLHEGLPYTAIESLGLGTPLIVSAVGGLKEALTNRENALLVPNADVEGFVHAIRELELDPGLRSRIAQQGRSLYESSLTAQAMVDGYMRLYADLAEGVSRR